MPTPRFNPATGQMELGEGAARYGTSGELLGDLPGGGSMDRSQGYDPRYYEQYQRDIGDSNTETAWRLRQDVQERMGNNIQVSQPGVVGRNPDGSIMEGQGFNEVLDPNQVTWDDEFGWVMPRENLSGSDPDDKARWNRIRMAAILAAAGGAAYLGGAFGGAGAGVGAGEGAGAAANAGLDAFEAGSFLSGGAPEAGMAINYAPAAATGGGSSFLDQAGNYLDQAGNYVRDTFSNLGTGGAEQLSGPGMEGITGAVGSGAGSGLTGGAMPLDLGWRDILSLGRDIVGGYMDNRNQDQNRDDNNARSAEDRQLRRELQFVDQNSPFATVRNVRDPVTGLWTQNSELNEQDAARLGQYRSIAADRMRSAAGIKLPENVDFRAQTNRYLPQSLGGSYVGTDYWRKT